MSILSKKEQQVLDSQREILWLKRQVEQLEKEDNFKIQEIPEGTDENKIKEGIKTYRTHVNEMKVQLDLVTLRNKKREGVAKAYDEHYFTLKALYPDRVGHTELEIKKKTEQLVNRRDELVSESLRVLEEIKEKQLGLTKIRGDVIKHHMENRDVMQRVNDLKQVVEGTGVSESTALLHRQIREQKNYIATLRAAISGLIMESDIDWVKDPKAFSIMTKAGEDL
ncbi:hypothetical protein INT47_000275 [Mucor saturninus]|uniref:Centromere protein H C-terminal domain-containing protein n=1 Tax=Mucor saturninus TaxID=64648 RepID=A0A8H7QWZ1_9FUNG|nr:hypothetical protein INT47_000275 [Mucor saturninus]